MSEHVKLQVFTQHSRSWRDFRYVYPVISRRSRGLSIGVNLNPDGVCNFDCVYCCVDRTHPRETPPVDVGVLGEELEAILSAASDGSLFDAAEFQSVPPALRRLNDIAFSGDGEPTASPAFATTVGIAASALAARGLHDVKLVLITNSTLLDRPRVIETLKVLDRCNGEIWAKLDAGTEAYYRTIERTSIPLDRVLQNILLTGRARAIVIQSMFLRWHGQPPDDVEIDAYAARLEQLISNGCRIRAVHLYTVARAVADVGASALLDDELDQIASRVQRLKVPIETFYSPLAG